MRSMKSLPFGCCWEVSELGVEDREDEEEGVGNWRDARFARMDDEDGPRLAKEFYKRMVKHGDSRKAARALNSALRALGRQKVPINRIMRFVHIGI